MDAFGVFVVIVVIIGFIAINLLRRPRHVVKSRAFVATAILSDGTTITAKQGRKMGIHLEWERSNKR